MKRLIPIIFAMLILLTACGKLTDPWQEQYDLGVRFLSEGNYEEAIIAFTAAIEIDPKREEAYVGLADVYYATGDNEKAEEILHQMASPESGPIMEQQEVAIKGFETDDHYVSIDKVSEEHKQILEKAIQIAEAGETEELLNFLQTDLHRIPEEFFWPSTTIRLAYGGYKFEIWGGDVDFIRYRLEMRPQSGTGYYLSWVDNRDMVGTLSLEQVVGHCENWNWNGEFSYMDRYDDAPHGASSYIDYTGIAVNGLIDGTVIVECRNPDTEDPNWAYYTYECVYNQGVEEPREGYVPSSDLLCTPTGPVRKGDIGYLWN